MSAPEAPPVALGDDYGAVWILETRRTAHGPWRHPGPWRPQRMYLAEETCRAAVAQEADQWREARAVEYTRAEGGV